MVYIYAAICSAAFIKEKEMSENNEFEKEAMSAQGPSLTLDPFGDAAPELKASEPQKKEADEYPLSDAEKKQVEQFAKQIDIKNSQVVMQYGAGVQKKMADFSDRALDNVRTKDLGETGQLLSSVVAELKHFGEEEPKGLLGFFKKQANKIETLKIQYSEAEVNVDRICSMLEGHKVQLTQDAAMLDNMYQVNLTYYKELTMYIAAGKRKLEEVRATELAQLTAKAQASGRNEDLQAASDLQSMCDRFDKKIHDLELTRMVSIQMAPQIRLIQNNDILMAEKIQSMIVNTVPLWKSQMVIALGVEHSRQAAAAQKEVTDMTNELLKKNAEALKVASVDTARELERGVVDIDTLKTTNELLISTMDEVAQIHEDGRIKRKEAEKELAAMEEELKAKLLEVSLRG